MFNHFSTLYMKGLKKASKIPPDKFDLEPALCLNVAVKIMLTKIYCLNRVSVMEQ